MIPAGVGPTCFLKFILNAIINQETVEHFIQPSADRLHGDADFNVEQHLPKTKENNNNRDELMTSYVRDLVRAVFFTLT